VVGIGSVGLVRCVLIVFCSLIFLLCVVRVCVWMLVFLWLWLLVCVSIVGGVDYCCFGVCVGCW